MVKTATRGDIFSLRTSNSSHAISRISSFKVTRQRGALGETVIASITSITWKHCLCLLLFLFTSVVYTYFRVAQNNLIRPYSNLSAIYRDIWWAHAYLGSRSIVAWLFHLTTF